MNIHKKHTILSIAIVAFVFTLSLVGVTHAQDNTTTTITPTPTVSATVNVTVDASTSPTSTASPTISPTVSPSTSPSPTEASSTVSASPEATSSPSVTASPSTSVSPTVSPTVSVSPIVSPTNTTTASPAVSVSPTVSAGTSGTISVTNNSSSTNSASSTNATTTTATSTDNNNNGGDTISSILSRIQALETELSMLWQRLQMFLGVGGNDNNDNTVTSPTITPSNVTVSTGASVDWNGRGFARDEQVLISSNGQTIANVRADGGGNFTTGSMSLPRNSGTYMYNFIGSQGSTASSTVTVQGSNNL